MKSVRSVFLICVLVTLVALSQNRQVYGSRTRRSEHNGNNRTTRVANHLRTCGKISPAYTSGNLALNKPANQTGPLGVLGAERAVDGILDNGASDTHSLRTCAHSGSATRDGGPAQWWVDLIETYRITTVTVYNTCNRRDYGRLNNFTVDIATSENTTRQSCGYYKERKPVRRGGKYTFHCNDKEGRYVYVSKLGGSPEKQHLVLCEVVVDGYLIKTRTAYVTQSSDVTPTSVISPSTEFTSTGSYTSASVESSSERESYRETVPEKASQHRVRRFTAYDIPKACYGFSGSTSKGIKWMSAMNDALYIRIVTVYHVYWREGSWGMDSFNIYVIRSKRANREVCAVSEEPRYDSDTASYVFKCNNMPGRFIFVQNFWGSTQSYGESSSGVCEVVSDGNGKHAPPPAPGLPCTKLPAKANQMGTYRGASADKAVDGLFDVAGGATDYYLAVCASVNTRNLHNEPAKLWLDLGKVYPIKTVTVFNTYNKEMFRLLNHFTVELFTMDSMSGKSCGVYSKPEPVSPGGRYTFGCRNKEGEIVFVKKLPGSAGQYLLTVCEVEVTTCAPVPSTTTTTSTTTTMTPTTTPDVGGLGVTVQDTAMAPRAHQVGTYRGAIAHNAIDGKFDRDTGDDYYLAVCASINTVSAGNGPAIWWLDMKAVNYIRSVAVYNTYNAASYKQLNHFVVEISIDNKTMHRCALYDDHDPVPRGGFHLFNCGATQAQWIYIRKLEGSPGQQYMTICEVVLEGHRITADGKVFTIAILSTVVQTLLHRPAYQSGTYRGATADKAVDGRLDIDTGSDYYLEVCAYVVTFVSGGGPATWWLDMMVYYSVSRVTVFNTYSKEIYWQLNHFTVEVVGLDNKTRQSCGVYSEPVPVKRGGSHTFDCRKQVGRFVYVRRLPGSEHEQLMTLCEVLVTGYPVSLGPERPRIESGSPPVTLATIELRSLVTCSIALSWILSGIFLRI